jgi:hypothetical protein
VHFSLAKPKGKQKFCEPTFVLNSHDLCHAHEDDHVAGSYDGSVAGSYDGSVSGVLDLFFDPQGCNQITLKKPSAGNESRARS